ncbi:hypothetical protein MTO96_005629 [Rhipicephalus appendiculatus]
MRHKHFTASDSSDWGAGREQTGEKTRSFGGNQAALASAPPSPTNLAVSLFTSRKRSLTSVGSGHAFLGHAAAPDLLLVRLDRDVKEQRSRLLSREDLFQAMLHCLRKKAAAEATTSTTRGTARLASGRCATGDGVPAKIYEDFTVAKA